MLYKSNLLTLITIGYSWYIVMSIVYGPSGCITHVIRYIGYILHCLGQVYAGIIFG